MKFVHEGGKHNKFWSYEIDADNYNVTVSWGRLGTKGQTKIYPFKNSYEAWSFSSKKVQEKARKGYREVDEDKFSLKKLQAILIGSEYKILELAFVKKDKRQIYSIIAEEAALANPDYEPLIYCSVQLTGKRGTHQVLIDTEKVYSCWQMGSSSSGNRNYKWNQYRLEDVKEVDNTSPEPLKKLAGRAPGIVSALIR